MKRFSVLAAVLAAAGCVREIGEADVFLPWMAEGTQFTIDDQGEVLFDRNRPRPGLWDEVGVAFEDAMVETPVGALAVRLGRSVSEPGPLIVHCGGNSYDIPSHGDLAAYKLAPHGDMLLWDYPGYGGSEGAPTVADFELATRALATELPRFQRTADQPIVFWGHSLGGFVCSQLAAAAPRADAIVFETSAPSAEAASKTFTPWYARPFLRVELADEMAGFDNIAALDDRPMRALVLGARRDRVLPVQLSRSLSEALAASGHVVTYHEFRESNHFHVGFQPDLEPVVASFLGALSP